MIRPLRRRHGWMVALIAGAVVVLFLAALAVRPEPALQESLPHDVRRIEQPAGEIGNEPAHKTGPQGDER